MKFTKRKPKTPGYYWYKENKAYDASIGYFDFFYSRGLKKKWYLIPFGGNSDIYLKKDIFWGSKIKEPQNYAKY